MEVSKRLVIAILAVLVILAGVWASVQVSRSKDEAQLVVLFNQGKNLECREIVVNRKEFNFVSGTLSFVGKPSTPYHGVTLGIDECHTFEGEK